MPITKRQTELLDRLIREYVNTAKPVSSELLKKSCRLDVCSATVRNEMQELAKKGYLKQPHTSAGRVPTNKAYRHFVDNLLEDEDDFLIKDLRRLRKETENVFKFAELATRLLSSFSSGIALTYLSDKDLLWEDGWREAFQNPEFEDKRFREEFLKAVGEVESRIKELEGEDIEVYIGRERSLLGSSDISLISSKRKKVVIALLGPSRMAYDKNIRAITSLTKLLEEF